MQVSRMGCTSAWSVRSDRDSCAINGTSPPPFHYYFVRELICKRLSSRSRFQGIDSASLCSLGQVRQIRLSYRPDRLGIDSWASLKVYKFGLRTEHYSRRVSLLHSSIEAVRVQTSTGISADMIEYSQVTKKINHFLKMGLQRAWG